MKIELKNNNFLIGYDAASNKYLIESDGQVLKVDRKRAWVEFSAKSDDLYQARVNSPKSDEDKNTLSDKWVKTHIIR